MSKENSKATMQVAKGANNAQAATTTEATTQKNPKTLEELQKENEELKQKLSVIPSDLEKKIEYFNRKKDLIRKLATIQDTKQELEKHLDNIAQLTAVNEFNNERYSLAVMSKEYRESEVFRITNPVFVGDVLTFILGRMENKEAELKKEIEA
jgi:ABC-type transporter Mla subunit MlaD